MNDESIDARSRAIIRKGLETNDPWLAELVRRGDAGETVDFSQAPETNEANAREDKIEALAEIICRGGAPDFMLELTRDEIAGISQFVTSSNLKFSKRVTAFTEQGVAMLSSVLRSQRAIAVSVEIMRTFVRLRRIISSNAELARRIDELAGRYDRQFKAVFDAIRLLMNPRPANQKEIGFRSKALK